MAGEHNRQQPPTEAEQGARFISAGELQLVGAEAAKRLPFFTELGLEGEPAFLEALGRSPGGHVDLDRDGRNQALRVKLDNRIHSFGLCLPGRRPLLTSRSFSPKSCSCTRARRSSASTCGSSSLLSVHSPFRAASFWDTNAFRLRS